MTQQMQFNIGLWLDAQHDQHVNAHKQELARKRSVEAEQKWLDWSKSLGGEWKGETPQPQ